MKTHDNNCVVCGARRTHFSNVTTCDSICSRANAAGRSRGKQILVELKAAALRPWSYETPVNPFGYDPSNNYNQPSEVNA